MCVNWTSARNSITCRKPLEAPLPPNRCLILTILYSSWLCDEKKHKNLFFHRTWCHITPYTTTLNGIAHKKPISDHAPWYRNNPACGWTNCPDVPNSHVVEGQQCVKESASGKKLLQNLAVPPQMLWYLLQDGRYVIQAAGGYPKCSRLCRCSLYGVCSCVSSCDASHPVPVDDTSAKDAVYWPNLRCHKNQRRKCLLSMGNFFSIVTFRNAITMPTIKKNLLFSFHISRQVCCFCISLASFFTSSLAAESSLLLMRCHQRTLWVRDPCTERDVQSE